MDIAHMETTAQEASRHGASRSTGRPIGGLAGWLFGRFSRGRRTEPRLALLERIALAPRQSLALVEAEGRRLLVATSPDGAPTFYPLDGGEVTGARARRRPAPRTGRVSW
ncbi:MAG TPA: flagellar biosynthetic protein FliO [Terracidiphilus sp.]|nr:flagellar biosynthetic protein FliO [Terracidiphilus sp.]